MAEAAIRGIFRKGRIRLLDPVPVDGETPVLVVFPDPARGREARRAWLTASRQNFLEGYARGDAVYDRL